MASCALVRGCRHFVAINASASSSLLAAHKNAAVTAAAVASPAWNQLQQTRAKSDAIQKLKHGREGRSSFTGNVVTVFGASGFMGRYIVNRLAKEGNQVIVPYRGDAYEVFRLKVAGDLGQVLFVPFHLRDQDSIMKSVKYSNWCINLIGREWQTKNFTFHDVHVDGHRAIAKACKDSGVDKLICMSALAASPDPPRKLPPIGKNIKRVLGRLTPIPESSACFLPNGSEWLRSKFYGEIAVREEFPEAIILRLPDVMGAEDTFLQYLMSPWRRNAFGYMPYYKKGEETVKAPISNHDVSTIIMHALKSKHIFGETFQCPGPHFYRMDELLDYFLECTLWHTQGGRVDLMTHPQSWITLLMCNFMELLFLNRPQYTWEKFERDAISDVLVKDYRTTEAVLPKGHVLKPIDKIAIYEIWTRRRNLYHFDKRSIPHPPPPRPLEPTMEVDY